VTNEPYADVREMYMAHTMFRREFGLLPELIDDVDAADAVRARIIAQHFELIQTVLAHHHHAEDEYLWPRILQRAGSEGGRVVAAMEAQHREIDKAIADLEAILPGWRETGERAQGAALADAARRLTPLLAEHLTAEEEQALPLVGRFVTAAEWGEMVAAGGAGIAPEQMPLLFGFMTYEGDPEVVQLAIDQMPPEIRAVLPVLAGNAFAQHATVVYGTATPAKSSELR
jgi:hemerythrin-like domain-containing protein